MSYFLDLFSPDTYEAFGRSDRTISGFRPRQRNLAHRVSAGDKLVCCMTRLSRWVGVLEVEAGPFSDATPIFYPENDPFTIHFRVRPKTWLPLEKTIPIHEDLVWRRLSFPPELPASSIAWTGPGCPAPGRRRHPAPDEAVTKRYSRLGTFRYPSH